jgi:hypothetical protein
MLRLIHNQTIQGGILVDDIDDGLPNKEIHRLGSTADPKAFERDGYAGKPKQACYVPYSQTNKGFPTVPGYINLNQTNRVTFSAGKGKIMKLSKPTSAGGPGLITVTSLTASQIVAPTITASAHGSPVTVAGTTFVSVSPDITSVTFALGTGATTPSPATFTAAQITAGGGSVSATAITIPSALFTSQAPVAGNTVTVTANEQASNTFTMT